MAALRYCTMNTWSYVHVVFNKMMLVSGWLSLVSVMLVELARLANLVGIIISGIQCMHCAFSLLI